MGAETEPSEFDSIRDRLRRLSKQSAPVDQMELGFTDLEPPINIDITNVEPLTARQGLKPSRPMLDVNVQYPLEAAGFPHVPVSVGSTPASAIPYVTQRRRHDRLSR